MSTTPVPTLTASSNGQIDYCQQQAPFTGTAADTFGADQVAAAYCTMVTLEMTQSFVDNYLRATPDQMTAKDFTVWDKYMTKETADNWHKSVAAALGGDSTERSNVYALMFYDALSGSGYSFADNEPVVLNQAFTLATATLQNLNGEYRLILAFTVSADLNVVKNGTTGPFYLIPISRDVRFALIRNPVQDDPDTAWLIDGYTGKFHVDKPTQRDDLATASTAPSQSPSDG